MKVSPPAPFTVVKGALDSSGPVLRWMFGDEEISLSVMRMINILPRVDPSEIVGDDEINQLFLHAEISKPAQDYVLHFLCGLYPDALGIHSVSLKHKLETSGLLEVPAKYNGPSFETHRYPAITPLRIFYSIFIYFGFKLSLFSLQKGLKERETGCVKMSE
ncbi:hypothetical protein L1987_20399 [Smallanthus sonchifolius]|uniref:Uncharacterized protein n=1 Tax=Smallanthus sonchifolius TaxID=185202 RepID=A0ACB9IUM7_9ASTR|nr:hypothetical protein L1987_20399 [Smallanthus sonchifolius]